MKKEDWFAILFLLLLIGMISLNELGNGVFALPLLIPACLLMEKFIPKENPSD